jgi:hypothetical protein
VGTIAGRVSHSHSNLGGGEAVRFVRVDSGVYNCDNGSSWLSLSGVITLGITTDSGGIRSGDVIADCLSDRS